MKKGVDKVGVRVYYMQALWGAGPEQVKKVGNRKRGRAESIETCGRKSKNLKKGLDKPNSL